jgi:hypothetical protein
MVALRLIPVAMLVAAASPAKPPLSAVTFDSPRQYTAGGGSPTIADFDGDGNPDVATIGADSVSVSLGDGKGGFQAPLFFAVGHQPLLIAVGDFNGDGRPDLVTGGAFPAHLSILLGNGDGTFQPYLDISLHLQPFSIAAADFNGDGKTDLAVSLGGTPNRVAILLSNGDGTFRHGDVYSDLADYLAVGDFNGDGIPDLAMSWSLGLEIQFGNGDGTFQPALRYDFGTWGAYLAVGDFNHDGYLDVAVAGDEYIYVMLNDGHGAFPTHVDYFIVGPWALSVADLNGDGVPDLIVGCDECRAGNRGYPGVSLLQGVGDGSFLLAGTYLGSGVGPPAAADFNHDGNMDLAMGNFNAFEVMLGTGQGRFEHVPNNPTLRSPRALAAGDFDGDGKDDLVVAAGDKSIQIMLGSGKTYTYALPFVVESIAVGDFNRDGKLDIAADFAILLGNGDGTFRQLTSYGEASAVTVADFNGDGIPDLAGFGENAQYVVVRLGVGDGTFGAPQFYPATDVVDLAAGDFNGDGKMDLAVVSTPPNSNSKVVAAVSILTGNGDGTFRSGTTIPFANAELTSVAVADLNHDGKLDLAVPVWTYANHAANVAILLGNEDGTFQPAVEYSVGQTPTVVVVADFNGDGIPDVAVGDLGAGAWFLLGKGDGTFEVQLVSYSIGDPPAGNPNPQWMLALDFNGDGKPDLASVNYDLDAVAILTNTMGSKP